MTQYPAQSNPSPEQDKTRAPGDINAQQTEAQKKQKIEAQTGADKTSPRTDHHSSQGNCTTKS
jgi:hypothetical protein